MARNGSDLERVAAQRFGYERLLPGQRSAMSSVLAARDTVVVMPTGSGKSAIYQVAGLLLGGTTVVVSPLIALQADQVRDAPGAVLLNSTLSDAERRATLERLVAGEVEHVYLAPEQLANPETVDSLRRARISLFAVDEAHCISEWGHDFRPEYLRLASAIEAVGRPPVVALTATASPVVRDEIVHRLALRDPAVFVHGFDRPNIWLGVEHCPDEDAKRDALAAAVDRAEFPGIVYVATRTAAEELSARLWSLGAHSVYYHGGMTRGDREEAQKAFMADGFDVVVATTAFGMGVDKPNVRFVFHHDVPESLDSYYQEVGRAGRDGEPAVATLFYRIADVGKRRFFASSSDDARNKLEASRLEIMRGYAETDGCRRALLLNYFGEPFRGPCGNCDNCDAGTSRASVAAPFAINARVVHARWGAGLVAGAEGDKLTVLFQEQGYKTLSTKTVVEKGLLQPADASD